VDNSREDEGMWDWHEEFTRRVRALAIVFAKRATWDEITKKTVGIANKHRKIAQRMSTKSGDCWIEWCPRMLEWFNEEIRCLRGWEIAVKVWNRVAKGAAVVVRKIRTIISWNCFKGIVAVESGNWGIAAGEWQS